MTRDDIIRMAREAGWPASVLRPHGPGVDTSEYLLVPALERFAALVAERDTALLRQALDALEHHVEQTRPVHRTSETITALRERLGVTT